MAAAGEGGAPFGVEISLACFGCGQVGLLLPQLGEQRLGAELGMSQVQPADGLQEAVGHAAEEVIGPMAR